jgi:hypothetical protein
MERATMSRWTPIEENAGPLCGLQCAAYVATLAVGLCTQACVIEEDHHPPPPDTEVGFDPVMNLGQACGAQLTSWSVTLQADGTTLEGGCGYRPVFGGLAPNATYSFEITGYSGPQVCWHGTCAVDTAFGTLTYGDCSQAIDHLCGL